VRGCLVTPVGYNAGPGYDLASGLGSVEAFNLITAWRQSGSTVKAAATMQVTSAASLLSPTDSTVLTAAISGAGGVLPTGTVTFYAGGASLGSAALSGSGSTATATLSVSAAQISVGTPETSTLAIAGVTAPVLTPDVTAIYGGDGNYASAAASETITVLSPAALVLSGITSAASFQRAYAPGMIVSLFGLNLAGSTPSAQGSPLPTQSAGATVTLNGIAAPLYYVSPTQINLQIPYAIPANSSAIVKITANGQTATSQLPISANAPEVFADVNSLLVPYQTTGRGQTIFLFATGDGLFTPPAVTTGSVPAAGTVSTSVSSVTVGVGGVAGTTAFVGVPSWSIGVTQINFTIPSNAPLGVQPVVVSVGGASSAPVFITVTP
jgi:uncharacterized protein (TIGR03437 family)